MLLSLNGDASTALAAIKQETSEVSRLIALLLAYHALGRQSDREAALSELIGKYEKSAWYNIAYVYANCGGADKALEQV